MKRVLMIIYGGLALWGVIIMIVFATGSTFGQRCAAMYARDSRAWESCVSALAARR